MKRKVCLVMIAVIAVIISSQIVVFGATNTIEVETRYAFDEMKEDYNQKYQFEINVPEDGRMRIRLSNIVDAEDWEKQDIRIKVEDSAYYASQGAVRYWNIKADQAESGWISVKKGVYPIIIEVPYRADLTSTSLYIDYEKSSEYVGEVENNDSFDEANIIEFDKTYEGNFSKVFSEYYDYDYYGFNVPSNGKLDLSITNTDFIYSTSTVDYILYYDDGSNNFKKIIATISEIDEAVINKVVRVPAGKYYLFIKTEGRYSCSEYTFRINYTAESSGKYEKEFNDYREDSNVIELNKKYVGNFNDKEDADWLEFSTPTKGYITAELWLPSKADDCILQLDLYDETVSALINGESLTGGYSKSNKCLANEGLYYVRLKDGGCWLDSIYDYTVRMKFECYKHKYGKYEYIKHASFNNSGEKKRTCTVCGNVEKTGIPKIKSASLSKTKYVYNGEKKKPDVIIKDSKGNKLQNSVDYNVGYASGRKAVGRHKVTVTFKGDYTGTKSLYFTVVPKATASVKARLSGEYDNVKITWKKVDAATGYLVSYKKKSSAKWSTPKDTKKLNAIVKNLDDGKQYEFRVIPYYKEAGKKTKYYSNEAAKKASIYTLKKISQNAVKKVNPSNIKISWKNISGENGYQVYKMTKKNGKYTVVKKYTTTKSYINIKSNKGKTYYYKVRAYKKETTGVVYGPWSNIKSYKL